MINKKELDDLFEFCKLLHPYMSGNVEKNIRSDVMNGIYWATNGPSLIPGCVIDSFREDNS